MTTNLDSVRSTVTWQMIQYLHDSEAFENTRIILIHDLPELLRVPRNHTRIVILCDSTDESLMEQEFFDHTAGSLTAQELFDRTAESPTGQEDLVRIKLLEWKRKVANGNYHQLHRDTGLPDAPQLGTLYTYRHGVCFDGLSSERPPLPFSDIGATIRVIENLATQLVSIPPTGVVCLSVDQKTSVKESLKYIPTKLTRLTLGWWDYYFNL